MKIQVLEGRPGPCTPANPTHRKQTKKAVALAERTKFGPLVAFVSPTETLNIEQLFYLMRQNFMAASIKLCQPSVLWQQRLNFLKFHPPSFFSFPVTHKLLRWIERGLFPLCDARQVLQTKMTMWRNRALRREERSRIPPPLGELWRHGVVVLWNSLHLALCRGPVRNCEWGCFPLLFIF